MPVQQAAAIPQLVQTANGQQQVVQVAHAAPQVIAAPPQPQFQMAQVMTAQGLQTVQIATAPPQVWSLTQFFSVDFSRLRINVKKFVFSKCTIQVCVSFF